jgi:hypothetical protein
MGHVAVSSLDAEEVDKLRRQVLSSLPATVLPVLRTAAGYQHSIHELC